MTAMRTADCGNTVCVSRGCEPVLDDRANPPTFDWRFARAVVPGDKQHQPVSPCDCLLEHSINGPPCSVKVHAVEVEHSIGLDIPILELSLPASIECLLANTDRPGTGSDPAFGNSCRGRRNLRLAVREAFNGLGVYPIPRQWPNCRGDACP